MSPIKDLHLDYEALNEEGTFSEGDIISGTVTFTLTEETRMKGLFVKAKGDVNVNWSDGDNSYSAHKRYFKLKEFLIAENGKTNKCLTCLFKMCLTDWHVAQSLSCK